MSLSASVVTVTTSATKLTSPATDNQAGQSILLQPQAAVFIGDVTVTSASGFPVASGATVAIDLSSGTEDVYAVTASGTASVNVLQTGI